MLSQLYIENVAVIEEASIDFHTGLNVMTGETGAGKSIIIDAIHAIIGERTSKEMIRSGANLAHVSAMFQDINETALEKLEELGYKTEEDGSLLIQRTIRLDGKGTCKINGRPATVSTLKAIAPMLINIHGQHESYLLLSLDLHAHYIDQVGRLDTLVSQYRVSYDRMKEIQAEWKACNMDEAEKARKMDLLQYQIDELESANLKVGEQEILAEQKTKFLNHGKIVSALNMARDILSGNEEREGVVSMLSAASGALEEIEEYLPAVESILNCLREIEYGLEDLREELRDASSDLEYYPEDLEQIEQRLDLLYRLSLKYGSTEEEMLQFLQRCMEEWNQVQDSEERLERLTQEYEQAKTESIQLAAELSERRSQVAEEFTAQVKEQLRFLDMPGVDFVVSQERVPLNRCGCDKMEFFLSTNIGEPLKPMAKIASGGELSRIMLAIKTVLADKDTVDTLIFDEVDTGISGSAAQKVGQKLREASQDRQVICVTHLAQIAALADHQYQIKKSTQNGKTFTEVIWLDFEGRKQELARLIGGSQITPLTLQNAEEMLNLAREK
ncbi:MAG: DNA repair protein RecN [Clostridiales bacterium]|jgi:DNA repair protein RecN (Recombination protein N)|nr:DNA repair protein RecN [Clostridiales bacterium]